jgi:CheY-like chemotaxis protein
LVLNWRESGGPRVSIPSRRGFGSKLIERALAFETGGRATIDYAPDGVVCEILLPQSSLVQLSAKAAPEVDRAEVMSVSARPFSEQMRLLIVEDSYLVILTLEAMCEDLGWAVVGPATRLAEAISLARSEDFEAALLDINLDGEMSWEVATILKERGIPFAFSTGYNELSILPDSLAGSQIFSKPYRIADVERCLRQMVAKGSAPEEV